MLRYNPQNETSSLHSVTINPHTFSTVFISFAFCNKVFLILLWPFEWPSFILCNFIFIIGTIALLLVTWQKCLQQKCCVRAVHSKDATARRLDTLGNTCPIFFVTPAVPTCLPDAALASETVRALPTGTPAAVGGRPTPLCSSYMLSRGAITTGSNYLVTRLPPRLDPLDREFQEEGSATHSPGSCSARHGPSLVLAIGGRRAEGGRQDAMFTSFY